MDTSPVTYRPGFISEPDKWFEMLWNELQWEKRADAPRKEYWTNLFDRPYTYGRGQGVRTYESRSDHPLIVEARNKLIADFGTTFEGCFLNGYEGKRDWLGWHADDDPGIDHSKPIAVITVGGARAIETRKIISPASKGVKGEYGPVEKVMLEPGSLFLMHAGMQSTHEHRIPKADRDVMPRISLTFRGLIA